MSKLNRYNLLVSTARYELEQRFLINGIDASDHNDMVIRQSLIAWVVLTDDLMVRLHLTEQQRNARLRNLYSFIKSVDASTVLTLPKDVYDILIEHISGKSVISSYSDFKGRLDDTSALVVSKLLSPIKEAFNSVLSHNTFVVNGCYRNDATEDFTTCTAFLTFLNKVNLTDVGLEEKGLMDYLECEEENKSFCWWDPQRFPYIKAARAILKDWLADFQYDGSLVQHGPGAVADTSIDKLSKYHSLAFDEKLIYLADSNGVDSSSFDGFSFTKTTSRCSKLIFVPKNVKKLRSISMEPATLQYVQQGCMKYLYRYFRQHKVLRRHLRLWDQTQNRSLAYDGSITNKYATIDLSHASDSIHWELVKYLFSGCPSLLKYIVCTRSSHTMLPDGRIIELFKYAPMGSSMSFPIESLIFAAITQLAIALSREEGLHVNLDTGIHDSNTFFSVYGDDIIVPQYAAEKCKLLLREFGFTPNEEKSYVSGPFKESCGINCFAGKDVTGIKFAAEFDEAYPDGISPSCYASLISYANLAYERNLPLFRLHCIHTILNAGYKPLFTDDMTNQGAIFSKNPTNFHLEKRWAGSKNPQKPNYQKQQFVYDGVSTVSKNSRVADDFEYYAYIDYTHTEISQDVMSNNMRYDSENHVLHLDVSAPHSRRTLLPNKVIVSKSYFDC